MKDFKSTHLNFGLSRDHRRWVEFLEGTSKKEEPKESENLPTVEEELTWDVVRKWKYDNKDFDADYCITIKIQPQGMMEGMFNGPIFFPVGIAYKSYLMYFLKGQYLFCGSLPVKEEKDFESKRMIDLSKCSLMTEIMLKPQHSSWRLRKKTYLYGEKFFYSETHEDIGMPWKEAFVLRFSVPLQKHYGEGDKIDDNGLSFSRALKRRIAKLTM